MSQDDQEFDTQHMAACIVAAFLWLAIAAYLLIVIPGLFSVSLHESKPDAMRAAVSQLEKNFILFQQMRGTFWIALFGGAGCGLAYVKRSSLLANLMIILGIPSLLFLIWATLASAPK